MKRIVPLLFVFFCIAGIALSAVSLRAHYSTSATEYCDLSATFNCDFVNRSIYSRFLGVPVALIGLVGYILLLGLSLRRVWFFEWLRLAGSLAGLGFALYLAYVEAYILAAWCLLCIGSLIAISAITVFSGISVWQTFNREPKTNA